MASPSAPSDSTLKRKRSSDPSSSPSSYSEVFSTFFNDPNADVILRSIDGMLFATRPAYLVAASSIFEDMFGLPQPHQDQEGTRFRGQAAPGILQTVHVAEEGFDFELLLRWIHRDTVTDARREVEDEENGTAALELVCPLLRLAQKYDIPTIAPLVVLSLQPGPGALKVDGLDLVAIAVIHDLPAVAESALWIRATEFEESRIPVRDKSVWGERAFNPRTGLTVENWRPSNLSDVHPEFFGLLPPWFFFAFAKMDSKMFHSEVFDIQYEVDEFLAAMRKGFPRPPTP